VVAVFLVTVVVIVVVDDPHPCVHPIDEMGSHVADDQITSRSRERDRVGAVLRGRQRERRGVGRVIYV
jgi:hypothetical protein